MIFRSRVLNHRLRVARINLRDTSPVILTVGAIVLQSNEKIFRKKFNLGYRIRITT